MSNRVVSLSLIALAQILTIVGGFFTHDQMSSMLSKLQWDYKELVERTEGVIIDYGLNPSPFAHLLPLVLGGLPLTIVLLVDEIRHESDRPR